MTENSKAVAVRQNGAVSTEHDKTKAIWAGANASLNTPEVARALAFLGERYDLDPALGEVTLLGGKVYITMEGYLRIAEQNPEYDGYELWPLTDDERKAMRVPEGDDAWGCKVYRKGRQFPSIGYGRASAATISMAPMRSYTMEVAQKRAMHRAMRTAFRARIPDPDQALDRIDNGDVVAVQVRQGPDKPPALPGPDWPRFWRACEGLGASEADVHQALGMASVKDWAGTLEDAYARVESFVAERDRLADGFEDTPSTDAELTNATAEAMEQPDPEIRNFGQLWTAVKERYGLTSSEALKELGFARQSDIAKPPQEIWAELKGVMAGRLM